MERRQFREIFFKNNSLMNFIQMLKAAGDKKEVIKNANPVQLSDSGRVDLDKKIHGVFDRKGPEFSEIRSDLSQNISQSSDGGTAWTAFLSNPDNLDFVEKLSERQRDMAQAFICLFGEKKLETLLEFKNYYEERLQGENDPGFVIEIIKLLSSLIHRSDNIDLNRLRSLYNKS